MWKESALYYNLAKVYGEEGAKQECERILEEFEKKRIKF